MTKSQSGLVFTDQSADDLWLTLASGELDTRQFSVLAEAQATIPRFGRVQAGIIGASHFLSVTRNGARFTEVFACMPDVRTERTLGRYPLRSLENTPVIYADDGYWFSTRKVPWDEGTEERDQLLRQVALTKATPGIGLSYLFPDAPKAPCSDKGQALTAVVVRFIEGQVHSKTLHAYPGSAMVFTTSTFGR